jgi:hypothetical protein
MKFLLLTSLLLAIGCASHSTANLNRSGSYGNVELPKGPFTLRLNSPQGDIAYTSYHSDSAVEDFEDGQKVRDHSEAMDFLVETGVVAVRDDQIAMRSKTIEKDGTAPLNDLAFPELDEEIDFVYSRRAQVLLAGDFPRDSIFYMPPVSLPEGAVDVGDTWMMDYSWISSNDGLPLKLSMLTIFKTVVACGVRDACADLEVSGQVDLIGANPAKIKFASRLFGRMLLSLKSGEILWSEVQARDDFASSGIESKVNSCMSSSSVFNLRVFSRLACNPKSDTVLVPK